MFEFLRKKTITVLLIDDNTSDPIGTHSLLPEDLPTTLEPFSMLTIAGQQWQLMDASPAKASAYLKTRKLTLFLVPPGQAGPGRKLYSIATVSNDLPASIETTDADNTTWSLSLHADDWRQIEFLPNTLLSGIHHELAAIQTLLHPKDGSHPGSFRQIHPRRQPRRTLQLSFEKTCRLLNINTTGNADFAKSDVQGHIKEGFALQSDNVTYYGTRQGDVIRELCIYIPESLSALQILTPVQDLCKQAGLVLVDWRNATILDPAISNNGH